MITVCQTRLEKSFKKLKNLIHVRIEAYVMDSINYSRQEFLRQPSLFSFVSNKENLDSALKQMMLFAKLVEIAPLVSNKKSKCQKKKTTKNTDGSHQWQQTYKAHLYNRPGELKTVSFKTRPLKTKTIDSTQALEKKSCTSPKIFLCAQKSESDPRKHPQVLMQSRSPGQLPT